jgi:hypothetical protein
MTQIDSVLKLLEGCKLSGEISHELLRCLRSNGLVNNETFYPSDKLKEVLTQKNTTVPWFLDCFKIALETKDKNLFNFCTQANPKRLSNSKFDLLDTQITTANDKHFQNFTLMIDGKVYYQYRAGNGSMANVNHKECEFYLGTMKSSKSIHDKIYSVQLKQDGRCIEVFIFNVKLDDGDSFTVVNIHSRTGPLLSSVIMNVKSETQHEIKISNKYSEGGWAIIEPFNKFMPNPKFLSFAEYFTIMNIIPKIAIEPNKMMVLIGEGTKDCMRPIFDIELKNKIDQSEYGPGNVPVPGWYCHTMMIKSLDGKTEHNFPIEDITKMGIDTCPIIMSPSNHPYWSFIELNSNQFTSWKSFLINGEPSKPIPSLVLYAASFLFSGKKNFNGHPIEGVVISKTDQNVKMSIKVKDPEFNDKDDA